MRIGAICIAAAIGAETVEGPVSGAVRVQFEHGAGAVCPPQTGGSVESAILALHHGGSRIVAIAASGETVEDLVAAAIRVHSEYGAGAVCAALPRRSVESAILAL